MAVATAIASAAIAAGMSAATAATVATVAAVASQISMVVGLVGVGLKVVGTITRDETLSEIGMNMGYAGLAGGIASAGVGSVAEAASDQLIGQVLSASTAHAVLGETAAGEGTGSAIGGAMGAQVATQTAMPAASVANAAGASTPPPAADISGATGNASLMGGPNTSTLQANAQAPVGGEEMGVNGFSDTLAPEAPKALAGPAAEAAPTAPTTATVAQAATAQAPGTYTNIQPGDLMHYTPGQNMNDWFDKLPDYVKASLLTQGAGAVGGLMSGAFGAMSASDKIDLERTIAARNQAQIDWRNKNNSYAPRISLMNARRPA